MGFAVDWVFVPICLWPLALAALVFGLRGRKLDDNPFCRKCGFDLASAYRRRIGAAACPQCRADLSNRKRIGLGRRVRRRGLLAAALPLLAACTAWCAWVGWYAAQTGNWEAYKPAWWLTREAGGRDPARRDAAVAELAYRVRRGQLSQDQVDALADQALGYQADLSRPWCAGWGDVLESAHDVKTLSDDRWRRYASQALVMRLEARPIVRRGDPFVLRLSVAPGRVGKERAFSLNAGFAGDVWIDKHLLHHADVNHLVALGGVCADPSAASAPLRWERTVAYDLPPELLAQLADGTRTCRVSFAALVGERTDSVDPPLAEAHVELSAGWKLQPASQPSVELVHDPRLEPGLRTSLTPECWWLAPDAARSRVVVHMTSKPLPIALAGEMAIVSSDTEIPVGPFAWRRGWSADWRNGARSPLPAAAVSKVDVLLRPSAAIAVQTVDVTEIWGEPVVLKDVPVMQKEPDRSRPQTQATTFPVLPRKGDGQDFGF